MIVLFIFVIIISTAVGIWLKNKEQKRSGDRSNRLQKKQDELLKTLTEKTNQDGN